MVAGSPSYLERFFTGSLEVLKGPREAFDDLSLWYVGGDGARRPRGGVRTLISVWLGLTAIHGVPVMKPAFSVGGVRQAMITHN
jgi:hypothetical protein